MASREGEENEVKLLSVNGFSIIAADVEAKLDEGDIQGVESSLRGGLALNSTESSQRLQIWWDLLTSVETASCGLRSSEGEEGSVLKIVAVRCYDGNGTLIEVVVVGDGGRGCDVLVGCGWPVGI